MSLEGTWTRDLPLCSVRNHGERPVMPHKRQNPIHLEAARHQNCPLTLGLRSVADQVNLCPVFSSSKATHLCPGGSFPFDS